MTGYQIFLMIELARLANVIPVNLEYDRTWELGEKLHEEFWGSSFNNPNQPEYECIEAFLKDKVTTLDTETVSNNVYEREQQAKRTLYHMGYQVENLWHIDDVKNRYNCTDEEAMEVLEAALQNEATMEQIWFALHFHADDNGLEEKEDEDDE